MGRWIGPMVVKKLINEQVAQVQELTGSKTTRTVHTSRLKMYADSSLNITTELKEHLEYESSALYIVEEF